MRRTTVAAIALCLVAAAGTTSPALAQNGAAPGAKVQPEFPPFDKATAGLTKVISTTDAAAPLWELYEDRKTGKLLAVLPSNYESQLLMIAPTVSGGDDKSGVMGGTFYVKWERINKKLALIQPNLNVRADDDKISKQSIDQLYTGSVMLSVPIVSMAPGGRPVIDLGAMMTRNTSKFFVPSPTSYMAYVPGFVTSLAKLTKAKAFPENIVAEYTGPDGSGRMLSLTFSISELTGTPGFKPRKADNRVGYFYDWHQDFSKDTYADMSSRYISRWNMEKADPKLKMSPPREPLVWYIEHTTPIRYRQHVKRGIQFWNKAFEGVGITGALEVRQQDATTGAYMDIDPEDARFNFFRWNMTDNAYAIGPSRTNPITGEILDADVVWHQGLTSSIRTSLNRFAGELSMQNFSAETLAWLDENPTWDPRVRTASPERQHQIMAQRHVEAHENATTDMNEPGHAWTEWASSHRNTACNMGSMLGLDISLMDAAIDIGIVNTDDVDLLDGVPEEFLGAMIAYISAHEVGHCLGLQHNMAASTVYSLEDVNSPDFEGPICGSVMDYIAVNINHGLGEVQGPYVTPELGPYDHWAIAYGYGPEDNLEDVLSQVSEPGHVFVSQSAMSSGSDPRNMTWDYGKDNIKWAQSRMNLVKESREKLLDEMVEDGESWAFARRRFSTLLGTQVSTFFTVSPWIGGAYIHNDRKGDPGDRTPIEDVPAAKQREALNFIIENSFSDDAFGLTPKLVRHMGTEHWWDPMGEAELAQDPSLTIHDTIGGIQATAMTIVMNPTTLRRVYDNEFRADKGDAFTLAELVNTVSGAVWTECEDAAGSSHSASEPMISSFRRNLQREHAQRLIDLALIDASTSPALRTISTLAREELRKIDAKAEEALGCGSDPYTSAHLTDIRARIAKALDAAFVIGK